MNVHSGFPDLTEAARPVRVPASPAHVRLMGLSTATAPHSLPQDEVLAKATRILGPRFAEFERLTGVFSNAGIDTRQSVVPFHWFQESHDWADRSRVYCDAAGALFERAAADALAASGFEADEIDTVVTVSSTGIATPTLEARASKRLGLRSDVHRVPLFGLGCAGGVTGLALAARLARAAPGSRVLLVVVELCTLSFRLDRISKADVIATALFGDGAAAACLSSDDDGGGEESDGVITVGEGAEHTWPDTLFIMGWNVDATGFEVVFDRSIPPFVRDNYRAAAETALAGIGLDPADVDRFVCHPGGAKVITSIEDAMALKAGTLDAERTVLARHGNMSAPTVLFVLEEALKRGLSGRCVLASLGPGFTASFLPIQVENSGSGRA